MLESGKSRVLTIEVLVDGVAVSPLREQPGCWVSREGLIFSEDEPISKAACDMINKFIHAEKKMVRAVWDHGDLL